MRSIRQYIVRFWNAHDTLDERVYFITLIVSVLAALTTAIVGFLQHLPLIANAFTVSFFIFLFVLFVISIHFPEHRNIQRVCLVIAVNFLFFPIVFYASGGINSGMSMFFLVGLFLIAIMLRGTTGSLVFIISLLMYELTITISQRYPQLVSPVTEWMHYQDVKVTLFQAGVSMYAITSLILRAYNRERERNAELLERLRKMSTRDALSGLYNRRELFRRLEVMYGNQPRVRTETLRLNNHYIAMFDVDNFKLLNDTYGHAFGDVVLSTVSRELDLDADARLGEFAARYGGEEFVCIFQAENLDKAFERADSLRKRVAALRWPEHKDASVTISGGVAACNSEIPLNQVVQKADELLFQAKSTGKNRVCISNTEK